MNYYVIKTPDFTVFETSGLLSLSSRSPKTPHNFNIQKTTKKCILFIFLIVKPSSLLFPNFASDLFRITVIWGRLIFEDEIYFLLSFETREVSFTRTNSSLEFFI